jgi:hypothetical protein
LQSTKHEKISINSNNGFPYFKIKVLKLFEIFLLTKKDYKNRRIFSLWQKVSMENGIRVPFFKYKIQNARKISLFYKNEPQKCEKNTKR